MFFSKLCVQGLQGIPGYTREFLDSGRKCWMLDSLFRNKNVRTTFKRKLFSWL